MVGVSIRLGDVGEWLAACRAAGGDEDLVGSFAKLLGREGDGDRAEGGGKIGRADGGGHVGGSEEEEEERRRKAVA